MAEAVGILRDIADALSEAHRDGLVHRDLKSENVTPRGCHALITDFGVAKDVGESTGRQSLATMGVALGTPTAMALEEAVADRILDHPADRYAFGAVAYKLLTGQPPSFGDSPRATLAARVTATPAPIAARRALPPVPAALVMRCLEKRPTDRWNTADCWSCTRW